MSIRLLEARAGGRSVQEWTSLSAAISGQAELRALAVEGSASATLLSIVQHPSHADASLRWLWLCSKVARRKFVLPNELADLSAHQGCQSPSSSITKQTGPLFICEPSSFSLSELVKRHNREVSEEAVQKKRTKKTRNISNRAIHNATCLQLHTAPRAQSSAEDETKDKETRNRRN
jgi:hypothetical protein